VRPQAGLTEFVGGEGLGARPQRTVGSEHTRRQALEQHRVVRGNTEMAQPALGVGHREREGAGRRARRVVLARQRLDRLAIRRHAGGKAEPHGPAGWNPDSLTQADNRIEDDAGGAGERVSVERQRPRGAPAAPEKARAIGFPFDRTLRASLEAQGMERPRARVAGVAGPAMTEQRSAVGQVLGFDEDLAERRMGEVVRRRREHDLGVARHVDLADARAVIADGNPAHFDVVFDRHGDIQLCRDRVVPPPEGGAVG